MSQPKRSRGVALTVLAGAAALAVTVLTSVQSLVVDTTLAGGTDPMNTSAQVESAGPVSIGTESDYFRTVGEAVRAFETEPGTISYCPLDQLNRPVCAYGELTSAMRAAEEQTERETITVDPAGWPGVNHKTTIPAVPGIDGSKAYSGWFWNRSHLIADSLGGEAIAQNLITGTRTQNVGSTQTDGQYAGGMAYSEKIARDYLDTADGDACPLYYAVTPQYTDAELIPRTVSVDMLSCDGSVNMRIEVFNAAQGYAIDYTTGAFTPAKQAQD